MRGPLVEPFFLLVDQLRQFVGIDPVLFYDLRRVHLVIESVMLSFAIQATRCIVVLIVDDLVGDMLLFRFIVNCTRVFLIGRCTDD